MSEYKRLTCVCASCGITFFAERKRRYCCAEHRKDRFEKPFTEVEWTHCNPHPPCLWCGKQTTRHDQKGFCSQSCSCKYRSYQSNYQHTRDNYLCEKGLFEYVDEDFYLSYLAKKKAVINRLLRILRNMAKSNTDSVQRESKCVVCGRLIHFHMGRKRLYCSESCMKKSETYLRGKRADHSRRRAAVRCLKASGHFDCVDPFEIFDRDGWRCRLCGKKTPLTSRGTTRDDAPELDHIVPLSKGGWHVRENLQCLCRRCNQMKSDSIESFQPNLFSSLSPSKGVGHSEVKHLL